MDLPIGRCINFEELSEKVSQIVTSESFLGPYTIVCVKKEQYQLQKSSGLLGLLAKVFSCCFGENNIINRYLTCAFLKEYHRIAPLKQNESIVKQLSWRTASAFQKVIGQFHVLDKFEARFQIKLQSIVEELQKATEDFLSKAGAIDKPKYAEILARALANQPRFDWTDPDRSVREVTQWEDSIKEKLKAISVSPHVLPTTVTPSAHLSTTPPRKHRSVGSQMDQKAPVRPQPQHDLLIQQQSEAQAKEMLDAAMKQALIEIHSEKDALIVRSGSKSQEVAQECERIVQAALKAQPSTLPMDPIGGVMIDLDKRYMEILDWQDRVINDFRAIVQTLLSSQHTRVSVAPLPSAPVIDAPLTEEVFLSSLESMKNGILAYKDALIASLPPLQDLSEPKAGVNPVTKESLFGGDCGRIFEEAHRRLPSYDSTKTSEENKLAIEQWYSALKDQLDVMASDYRHIMAPPIEQIVSQCTQIAQDGFSCGPIALVQSFAHTKKIDYFLRRKLVRKAEESDEQYTARIALQRTLCGFVEENRRGVENPNIPQALRGRMSDCYRADHRALLLDVNQQVTALRESIVEERNPIFVAIAERFCGQTIGLTETAAPSVVLEGLFQGEVEMLEQVLTSSITPEVRGANPELDQVLNALAQSPNDREKYFLLRKLRWILQGKSPAEIQKKDKKLREASQQRDLSALILNAASFFKEKFGSRRDISKNVRMCFRLASSMINFMRQQHNYRQDLRDINCNTTVADYWFEKILTRLDCTALIKRLRGGRIKEHDLAGLTSFMCNPPGHFYVYVRTGVDAWTEINWGVGQTIKAKVLLEREKEAFHYGI